MEEVDYVHILQSSYKKIEDIDAEIRSLKSERLRLESAMQTAVRELVGNRPDVGRDDDIEVTLEVF